MRFPRKLIREFARCIAYTLHLRAIVSPDRRESLSLSLSDFQVSQRDAREEKTFRAMSISIHHASRLNCQRTSLFGIKGKCLCKKRFKSPPFYRLTARSSLAAAFYPFITIIMAEFTLFIPAWIIDSFSDPSTHSTLRSPSIPLYHRAITYAARRSRDEVRARADPSYQSSSGISRNVRSHRRRRDVVKWSRGRRQRRRCQRRCHGRARARTCRIRARNVARQKLFTARVTFGPSFRDA